MYIYIWLYRSTPWYPHSIPLNACCCSVYLLYVWYIPLFFKDFKVISPRNVSWRFSRLPHRKGLLRSTQRMHVGKPKVLRRGGCGNAATERSQIIGIHSDIADMKGGNHTGDMTGTMVDNAWGLRAGFIQISLIWQGNWRGLADEKISLCQPKHNPLLLKHKLDSTWVLPKKRDYHFC